MIDRGAVWLSNARTNDTNTAMLFMFALAVVVLWESLALWPARLASIARAAVVVLGVLLYAFMACLALAQMAHAYHLVR